MSAQINAEVAGRVLNGDSVIGILFGMLYYVWRVLRYRAFLLFVAAPFFFSFLYGLATSFESQMNDIKDPELARNLSEDGGRMMIVRLPIILGRSVVNGVMWSPYGWYIEGRLLVCGDWDTSKPCFVSNADYAKTRNERLAIYAENDKKAAAEAALKARWQKVQDVKDTRNAEWWTSNLHNECTDMCAWNYSAETDRLAELKRTELGLNGIAHDGTPIISHKSEWKREHREKAIIEKAAAEETAAADKIARAAGKPTSRDLAEQAALYGGAEENKEQVSAAKETYTKNASRMAREEAAEAAKLAIETKAKIEKDDRERGKIWLKGNPF